MVDSTPKSADKRGKPNHRGQAGAREGANLPDILYHATDVELARNARDAGVLSLKNGRKVFMSKSESQAWQVSHRGRDEPLVLYIDAGRARQAGTKFQMNKRGLWQAPSIPVKHVLNLRDGFKHQYSAGGFPVYYGPNGPEVALIKVRRRFGSTWEIAKGKLEPGENPEQCAIREIQEEMGAEMTLSVDHEFGFVRYGFMTPARTPRLKTMYVYQFRCEERIEKFTPAAGESVVDVGWFNPRAVDRVVTHRSLRPLVRLLLQNLKSRN
jgi:8-oxo-dGTP pyrophosphatase MutT (NUDIX family)